MCPYTVMYELSKEHAEPIEPTVIRAAVATNITLRPTISAKDPAKVERWNGIQAAEAEEREW